jgi:hypothetical protein
MKEIENGRKEIENGGKEIENGEKEIENGVKIENDARETVKDYLVFQHDLKKRPLTYCYYIVLENYHLLIYRFFLEVAFDFLYR